MHPRAPRSDRSGAPPSARRCAERAAESSRNSLSFECSGVGRGLVRNIRLEFADAIDDPKVRLLMETALKRALPRGHHLNGARSAPPNRNCRLKTAAVRQPFVLDHPSSSIVGIIEQLTVLFFEA